MHKFNLLTAILFSFGVFGQNPYVLVLGIAQDGGFPQADCKKTCCKEVWAGNLPSQSVASIALIDPKTGEKWIFDATPDFPKQLNFLEKTTKSSNKLAGIFLSHAHIGHYSGLMYLGREVMGANQTKVFVMPKMKVFLENNGPWSQLVQLKNIDLVGIEADRDIVLNERIRVRTFKVPHRDEFSETVGFQIICNRKKLIYIPDIDKWQKWNKDLKELVMENDILLLDGTFYQDGEIARPMSEVPHPFVVETINLLANLPAKEKNKVKFIHLNHTNPILQPKSPQQHEVRAKGFDWAKIGQRIEF